MVISEILWKYFIWPTQKRKNNDMARRSTVRTYLNCTDWVGWPFVAICLIRNHDSPKLGVPMATLFSFSTFQIPKFMKCQNKFAPRESWKHSVALGAFNYKRRLREWMNAQITIAKFRVIFTCANSVRWISTMFLLVSVISFADPAPDQMIIGKLHARCVIKINNNEVCIEKSKFIG